MEENRSGELSQQELDEVAKLFEDFAAQGWSGEQEAESPEPEVPEEEAPAPAPPKKPSRKTLLTLLTAGIAVIAGICLCLWFFRPSPIPAKQPVTFSARGDLLMAVTNEGKILTLQAPQYTGTKQAEDVLTWTDIVSISVGPLHTMGLKKDGTVICTGFQPPEKNYINFPANYVMQKLDMGQTKTDNWTDIVGIAAGYQHSVGLRKDGTVVAVGDNTYGQCNVAEWTDIIQISADIYHTVGLRKDGTVVSTKIPRGQPDGGQCNVDTWTDIVYISAGPTSTIGVRDDGTVVAAGANARGQCNVATWTNISAVAAGPYHAVGLKKDGTVVSTRIYQSYLTSTIIDYGQSDVLGWTDIVAVAVTDKQTFGLKKDGTVVYAGEGGARIDEAKSWSNIRVP